MVPRWKRRADVVQRRRLRVRGRWRELHERGLRRAVHVRRGVLLPARLSNAHVVLAMQRRQLLRGGRCRPGRVRIPGNVLRSVGRGARVVQRGVLRRDWRAGEFNVRRGLHLRRGGLLWRGLDVPRGRPLSGELRVRGGDCAAR